MVGRGALIKPWLFGEYAQGQAWEPTVQARGLYSLWLQGSTHYGYRALLTMATELYSLWLQGSTHYGSTYRGYTYVLRLYRR